MRFLPIALLIYDLNVLSDVHHFFRLHFFILGVLSHIMDVSMNLGLSVLFLFFFKGHFHDDVSQSVLVHDFILINDRLSQFDTHLRVILEILA